MIFHTDLPIQSVLPDLVTSLKQNPKAVVTAPPGAGKSTAIPLALLAAGMLDEGQLVMLEPRRIAARMCATRMAELLNEPVGEQIGYQIRFDKKASSRTRVLVVTEGILTRRLIRDPFLEGISTVIIDEFHERSVPVDLALAFVRELLTVRADLRLVVMSATLDAKRVSDFLAPCPVIVCEAAPFPLSIQYDGPSKRPLVERAKQGIKRLLAAAPRQGDLLVFMPGAHEIRTLGEALEADPALAGIEIVPLYGALSHAAQDRALRPGEKRRVVIATNIAETSLTIPRITGVVDSGLKKEVRFDPKLGLDRLETVPISNDGAVQRAGRAGRTSPGVALRLWTPHDDRSRPARDVPEMVRVDAAPVLLQMLAFGVTDPMTYPLLDEMDADRIDAGTALLVRLGAVEPTRMRLTKTGVALAALPLHPRLGAMLLYADSMGESALGATVAALAAEADIMMLSHQSSESVPPLAMDFDYRVELIDAFEKAGATRRAAERLGLHYQRAGLVLNARDQLRRATSSLYTASPHGFDRPSASSPVTPGALLLAGFPDRVIRLKDGSRLRGTMVGGRGVQLVTSWTEDADRLFVAVAVRAGKRGVGARESVSLMSPVSAAMLEAMHPALVTQRTRAHIDPDRGVATVLEETCFIDLVIAERPAPNPAPDCLEEALVTHLTREWESCFKPDADTARLIARMRYAARIMPDIALPDVSDAGLKAMLPDVCHGKHTVQEAARGDWKGVILGRISYSEKKRFDDAFPERWTVPSGSAIRIDYTEAAKSGTPPVLACRLQELFGLHRTPDIADGRVALTLHLLAPNGRPCQVTQDLESFWRNTYPAVRRDLRGRYPKHDWPEDPYFATATRRVRPKSR